MPAAIAREDGYLFSKNCSRFLRRWFGDQDQRSGADSEGQKVNLLLKRGQQEYVSPDPGGGAR